MAGPSSVPPTRACVQRLPSAGRARSIPYVRALKETRRYWLPLAAAALCLFAASWGVPPLAAYALIAAPTWLARAGGTGGIREYTP
jgi:hypothetical protein